MLNEKQEKLFMEIGEELGYDVSYYIDKVVVDNFRDQDRNDNMIFIRESDLNDIPKHQEISIQLTRLYTSVFGTGRMCSVRSELYRKKKIIKDNVTFVTIASVLQICMMHPRDMDLISNLLWWLSDGNR